MAFLREHKMALEASIMEACLVDHLPLIIASLIPNGIRV